MRAKQVSDSYYDVAQICQNGHVVNSMTKFNPVRSSPFCEKCGSPTTTSCAQCHTPIRGYYSIPGVISSKGYSEPPTFCYKCGNSFPWTELKIQAAIEMFAEEVTDAAERKAFQDNLNALSKDTPQAEVAAVRIRKQIAKLGKSAGKSIVKMVVDVASEMIKKSFTG